MSVVLGETKPQLLGSNLLVRERKILEGLLYQHSRVRQNASGVGENVFIPEENFSELIERILLRYETYGSKV